MQSIFDLDGVYAPRASATAVVMMDARSARMAIIFLERTVS